MFYWRFHLTMKPPVIAHLLYGSEHIYWILDLEGECTSMWDLWVSGIQECKSNDLFWNFGRAGERASSSFWRVQKFIIFWTGGCPYPILTPPKSSWGEFNVLRDLPFQGVVGMSLQVSVKLQCVYLKVV